MENKPRAPHPSLKHEEQTMIQIPLSGIDSGKIGIVRSLEGDREFMNQVACLGFTLGAQVTVLQNHGQGPLIVSMRGAHIALGRHEAALIQVQLL